MVYNTFMIKLNISPEDREKLLGTIRHYSNSEIITRKAKVILFIADGGRLKQAARISFVSMRTAQKYVNQYRKEGVEGLLRVKPRSGRPSKVSDNIADIINDALKRSPAVIKCLDTVVHNWTLALMQKYLKESQGIEICIGSTWGIMKKHGIRHIYSKAVTSSPDPRYNEKREAIEDLKKRWRTTT